MRTIKFRAWDSEGEFCPSLPERHRIPRMYYDVQDTYDNCDGDDKPGKRSFGEVLKDKRYTLMQFTGLLDKNGKEIYEGDVVRNNDSPWTVDWKEGGFYLSNTFIILSEAPHCEVIGNIYEHPHLLKEKVK